MLSTSYARSARDAIGTLKEAIRGGRDAAIETLKNAGISKRMKVLMISELFASGGAHLQMMEMLSILMHDPELEFVVLTANDPRMNQALDALGVENHAVGFRAFAYPMMDSSLRSYAALCRNFLRYHLLSGRALRRAEAAVDVSRFDLIYTYINRVDIGAKLAAKYRKPHLMHLHEYFTDDYNCKAFKPRLYRTMDQSATAFVAISNAVRKAWIQKGLTGDKIRVVYNGILERSEGAQPDDRRLEGVPIRIVMLGTLCESKGQDVLIRAIALLPEEVREKLLVDLRGPSVHNYGQRLKALADNLGVGGRVALHGEYQNAFDALAGYDIGIMASRSEGFGRVTVEYMMGGLAVIASNSGANAEIVTDGLTGLLFQTGSPESLAEKILELVRNPQKIRLLALNGQADARGRFSIAAHAEGIRAMIVRSAAGRV